MMNVCTPEHGHQQLQNNRRREGDDRQGRTLMEGEHISRNVAWRMMSGNALLFVWNWKV